MKITSVEPQKKNPKRFNIFLDGKFAFGADEDTIVDNRLIFGKEIITEDLEKLLFEVEVGKLVERVYGLLNVRYRSEKEIRDYVKNLSFKRKIRTSFASRSQKSVALTRRTLRFSTQNVKEQDELSEVVIEALITKLKKRDLINDLRFAKEWVEARRKSKKKGINAIKAELFQKGIKREIVEEALALNEEGNDEEKLAREALEKKLRVWGNLPEQEFKQKALPFLMRRGFDYYIAKKTVDSVLEVDV